VFVRETNVRDLKSTIRQATTPGGIDQGEGESLMLRQLHDRLGTAGLVIAVIALVAALTGTAFAAKGALNSKQKKEVEKIAKKYAGKPGAPGTTGPQGVAGPKGDAGLAGKDGTNGTNGVSASTASFAGAKGSCTAGGTEVKSASPPALVCNGVNGQTGFTDTLPSGKTETGTWSFTTPPNAAVAPSDFISLSFNIPLSAAPAVHYVKEGEIGNEVPGCSGGTAESPKADAGNLCVYASSGGFNAQYKEFAGFPRSFKSGALLLLQALNSAIENEEPASAFGTWAVTAN
jgi:hypothetical protein